MSILCYRIGPVLDSTLRPLYSPSSQDLLLIAWKKLISTHDLCSTFLPSLYMSRTGKHVLGLQNQNFPLCERIIEMYKSQHLPASIVPLIEQIAHQRSTNSTCQSISILLLNLASRSWITYLSEYRSNIHQPMQMSMPCSHLLLQDLTVPFFCVFSLLLNHISSSSHFR